MEIGRRDPLSLMTSSTAFQVDEDVLSASGHVSDPPYVKKKHHRRARKGRRRNQSGRGMSSDDIVEEDNTPPLSSSPAESSVSTDLQDGSPPKKQKLARTTSTILAGRKRGHNNHQVYLRPTNGPLLNAPRNSTQFIIDDHENSNYFFNFENGGNNQHMPMPPPALPNVVVNSEAAAAVAVSSEAVAATAAVANTNNPDDDDNVWAEYSERDFQSVYESVHQEEIAEWDRQKLCDEISALERRQRELVNILARMDPEMYLQRLQSELLSLQEVNRVLKEEQSELNPALPDSSTAEDSAVYVEEDEEDLEGGTTPVEVSDGGDSQSQPQPQQQREGEEG